MPVQAVEQEEVFGSKLTSLPQQLASKEDPARIKTSGLLTYSYLWTQTFCLLTVFLPSKDTSDVVSMYMVDVINKSSYGIISASGGDGRPDAGGGSGGLISVSYEDAFIRDNPVAYGGSGLQHGASGVVYLQKLTSGDVHSKVTGGGRFVPLKAFSGPTNLCVYTGEMVGDVSSSITVSRGTLFHLSACGCPSCQYGQKPSIDIDTNIKVEQDGLLRVPEEVSVGYGVTIDICGTLDGLQDGHMSLYHGAKFRASYPANSGSYNSTVSSLVIKDVNIFKDSYFGGSSSCPSTKTLTLFSEIFSINYGGTFDQNSFTVDNSTNVERYQEGVFNSTQCPLSGELVLIANEECFLPTGDYIYSSVIIEGGATLILEGSWDGNGTTSITTEDLVVGAGGLITAVGGGLAETGELQCGHDSSSLGALYEPRFYGSGGTLVSGGGQVSLDVTNRTHLDGTIDVSGEDHYSSVSSGNGGSGGSILIKTETLSGFGLMQTSGGNTLTGCGGSGGRIAVHIGSEMSFVGQFSVAAGEAPNPGRSGVIFVEDHSTDTTKIVIHGSDRLPSLIRKGDLANLTEVDELVVEAGGILQLEESSLKVGMLSGDKTGVIQVTGRATLVVESSSVQGTECSFEVSHNSELELGENVHLSGEVVPVLHLDGTLTTDHIVLGEGTVSFLSSDGFMNVTSVTLEELSHLEIASGATIGRNSSDSQVTLEEYEIGAGAEVVFGSMDTRITANTIVVRSEAKVISSSALQKFYIHAEDIVIEADAVISVDFGGYSDAGVGSPEDTTSGASHGGQGGHLGYLEAGSTYGNTHLPESFGSGCASGSYSTRGGGQITIEASKSFVFDGTISARGQGTTRTVGAGSGGSIFLSSPKLSGLGYLVVTGGGASTNGLGGGGGGRIGIESADMSEFHGDFDSTGGVGYPSGAAGTVGISEINGVKVSQSLLIDNKGKSSQSYSVHSVGNGDEKFGKVTIRGNGRLTFDTPSDVTLSFSSLEGDLTGLLLVQSQQRISVARKYSTNAVYPLQCAKRWSKEEKLYFPRNLLTKHSKLCESPFDWYLDWSADGRGGCRCFVLSDIASQTAVRDVDDQLLYTEPYGTLAMDSLVIHEDGTLVLFSTYEHPMVLSVLREVTVHYAGIIRSVWMQIQAEAVNVETGGVIDTAGQGWTAWQGQEPVWRLEQDGPVEVTVVPEVDMCWKENPTYASTAPSTTLIS
ncbi:hypothetical protein BSL78_29828 [Apostichopus japonicus]|uniref:Tenascin-X n=1 Tax=Stichopus japonicus TaxID=307972 RepID=A0A2G8JC86_STIJA|nr:hypothetical protein BSL78_29828 [Apostichopus japonicus]